MDFYCDLDGKSILISTFWCIVTITITIVCLLLFKRSNNKIKRTKYLAGIIAMIFLFVIFVYLFLSRPTNLIIDNNNIVISKIKGTSEIPINTINEIRRLESADIANTVRTNASGGLFGYIGDFYNPQLGDFKQYSTNLDKRILIKTTDDIWVVSCSEPDKFIAVVKEKIGK